MTIVKSLKVKGYPHRSHRSSKGRKLYKSTRFRAKFYKIKKENIKIYGTHKRKTKNSI